MNMYKTLNSEFLNLDELTKEEKAIYNQVKSLYDTGREWSEFKNAWIGKVMAISKDIPSAEVVEQPIYKICQDLDSRLGIKQGYTREPDYRDLLDDVISIHFQSRYQFCKLMDVDEGDLSRILQKKKDFSVKRLQDILDKMNYRIALVERLKEPTSHRSSGRLKQAAQSDK